MDSLNISVCTQSIEGGSITKIPFGEKGQKWYKGERGKGNEKDAKFLKGFLQQILDHKWQWFLVVVYGREQQVALAFGSLYTQCVCLHIA